MGNLDMNYIPTEHGIMAINENELPDDNIYKIYHELCLLVHEPKCNPGVQLIRWKRLGPQLLKLLEVQDKINKCQQKTLHERATREKENHYKHWRNDEEEMLIQLAANGNMSITDLSQALGRTPAAISTKLSSLVGIGRVSQEIAGRFIGLMNGEQVSGDISGLLTKTKRAK